MKKKFEKFFKTIRAIAQKRKGIFQLTRRGYAKWRDDDIVIRSTIRIAAVSRCGAERHEDNSGNRGALGKMERSDILANVRVYAMLR